jgi:hypothetical protein
MDARFAFLRRVSNGETKARADPNGTPLREQMNGLSSLTARDHNGVNGS